jgi:hypothetical protein
VNLTKKGGWTKCWKIYKNKRKCAIIEFKHEENKNHSKWNFEIGYV